MTVFPRKGKRERKWGGWVEGERVDGQEDEGRKDRRGGLIGGGWEGGMGKRNKWGGKQGRGRAGGE